MTKNECESWLTEVIKGANDFTKSGSERSATYEVSEVFAWLGQAQSALEAVLPTGHAILKQWEQQRAKEQPWGGAALAMNVDPLSAMVKATLIIVQSGRLGSLLDGIRTETESEVLDQADHLVDKGYLVAAAVLAGGALETHLHFLCSKHGLSWDGHGSIGKYDRAIAQARKLGNEVYSATDSKQITAWGGMRNDAAHKPTEFNGPKERVALMVDGIRGFIARVS